ncbi:Acetyl xylan esterase (AXE1) [uncultured archaeon]|nr:Acetyl xylan esterase (AXE1) [uncultured archaeon]
MGLLVIVAITAFVGLQSLSENKQDWSVTSDGLLDYPTYVPEYQLKHIETSNNSTLYDVRFTSRDVQIAGLLRMPQIKQEDKEKPDKGIPSIVLLPGATVTKEREQGVAKYLCGLGFAIITLDQRNLGATDMQGDLQMFLKGIEPTEHKMVHDALAAAEVLRNQPEIDPNRILYVGESNGGRFAVIACALDPKARGVIAISTSGYGIETAIASGMLKDSDTIRFYKSIDPETYLSKIPPRKLVMFHSINDPVIPYEYANRTYEKALQPKDLYTVKCRMHGHCADMDASLEKELTNMVK